MRAAAVAALVAAGTARGAAPAAEDAPLWGVSIHAKEPLRDGEAAQLAAAFTVARTDLTWSAVEKEAGEYDFGGYPALVDQLIAAGMTPMLTLDYANPLYGGGKMKGDSAAAAFGNFSAAAMARFAGRGLIYELWNEPNNPQFLIGAVGKGAKEYAAVASAVRAARAARGVEAERVVGPALWMITGASPGWLRNVCDAGGLSGFDAVTVHPYGLLPGTPEGREDGLGKVQGILRDCGGPREVWSGEWGYSTCTTCTESGVPLPFAKASRDDQARYLARMWLTNAAVGVRASVWYEYMDGTGGAGNEEARFGTVEYAYLNASLPHAPKPSYAAAVALQAAFGGRKWAAAGRVGNATGPGDLRTAAFRRAGDGAAGFAAWRACGAGGCGAAAATFVRSPGACFARVAMLGDALPPVCADAAGSVAADVTGNPLYFIPQ